MTVVGLAAFAAAALLIQSAVAQPDAPPPACVGMPNELEKLFTTSVTRPSTFKPEQIWSLV